MKNRVFIALALCTINATLAIEFQGGSGTPNDPYQIGTTSVRRIQPRI